MADACHEWAVVDTEVLRQIYHHCTPPDICRTCVLLGVFKWPRTGVQGLTAVAA